MTRTTPPRPVDIAALFPLLQHHSSVATRLHPRRGDPTVMDSSVGGPLLWPAEEAWPYCDDPHDDLYELDNPAVVRRARQLLAAAEMRTAPGELVTLTDEELAELPRSDQSELVDLAHQPVAMIPVMQLYRRDVPGFRGPRDSDLMQVLWCPIDHDRLDYCPRVQVKWRRLADIGKPLTIPPPEPAVGYARYLPYPCVLHPEQVTEFAYHGLPTHLRTRIRAWQRQSGYDYFGDLSVAPGWKLGGFTRWTFTDPRPMLCDCGARLAVLMAMDSTEWDGASRSWRPDEDEWDDHLSLLHQPAGTPTGIHIGRSYTLWIYYCPRSYDHPAKTAMQ